MAIAHPDNAAGPFYVEQGCCLRCGVPIDVAPAIFDWAADESQCIVKQQPASAREVDRILIAICSAEVDCIRYRGGDPALARRLAQAGQASNCDISPTGTDARPRLRSLVQFDSLDPDDAPRALASRLRCYLAGNDNPFLRIKPSWPWSRHKVVYTCDHGFGWRPHYDSVRFVAGSIPGRFRARLRHGFPGAGVGLSLSIHQWLIEAERVAEPRWFAADEDPDRDPGFHQPV